jgi:CcmD family protein
VSSALTLGELPALPLHEAGKYVAGAYVVLFLLVLIYVAIMATRLSRVERELDELLEISERSATSPSEALDVGRPGATAAAGAPTE